MIFSRHTCLQNRLGSLPWRVLVERISNSQRVASLLDCITTALQNHFLHFCGRCAFVSNILNDRSKCLHMSLSILNLRLSNLLSLPTSTHRRYQTWLVFHSYLIHYCVFRLSLTLSVYIRRLRLHQVIVSVVCICGIIRFLSYFRSLFNAQSREETQNLYVR